MALNILIVDDSTVMRRMLVRILRLCSLPVGTIQEASDGQQGLEALSRGNIDLVLVDINMPIMNGMEMFEKSRENPKTARLPFVFVSSDSSAARVETLLKKGAAFVHKPLSAEELLATITNVLGGNR